MKFSAEKTKRTPRPKATDVLAPVEEAIGPRFELKEELSQEDQKRFRENLHVSDSVDAILRQYLHYALLFPQDRLIARKVIEPRTPLEAFYLPLVKLDPLPWLMLFPEQATEVLAKLGTPEQIIEHALEEEGMDYLIVAYLFLPEHYQYIGPLRDKWKQLFQKDQADPERFVATFDDLAWLKICDPELYAAMPATSQQIDKRIKQFRAKVRQDRRGTKGSDNSFDPLVRAFALHVLTGGAAVFAGDHVVVRPKTKLRQASPLPDRLTA